MTKKKTKKNNKGFTLIEILAVIVVVTLVMGIAIPNVLKIVNNSKDSSIAITTANIKKSARYYVKENSNEVIWTPEKDELNNETENIFTCVHKKVLVNKGYLDEKEVNNKIYDEEEKLVDFNYIVVLKDSKDTIYEEKIDKTDDNSICNNRGNVAIIPDTSICNNPTYNENDQALIDTSKIDISKIEVAENSNLYQKNAGIYDVELALKEQPNNEKIYWEDGSTGNKKIKCSINKADPIMYLTPWGEEPKSVGNSTATLTSYVSGTITSIKSSNKQIAEGVEVDETGIVEAEVPKEITIIKHATRKTNTYITINFSPSDKNYNNASLVYTIGENKKVPVEIPSDVCESPTPTYNEIEQLLIKEEYSTKKEYMFINHTAMNAGSYQVIAKLKWGYIWKDTPDSEKFADKTFTCKIDRAKPTVSLNPEYIKIIKTNTAEIIAESTTAGVFTAPTNNNVTVSVSPTTSTDSATINLTGTNPINSTTVPVKFTPSDTTNYEPITKNIIVEVINNTYKLNYQENLFAATTSGTNQPSNISASNPDLKFTYTENGSYLTLNGTWTTKTFGLWNYDGGKTISVGDKYEITLKHISGDFTREESTSTSLVMDITANGTSNLDGRQSGETYIAKGLPLNNSTNTGSITIGALGATGNGLRFWGWQNTATKTIFNNYKVQVLVTKISSKNVTYDSAYGTLPTPIKKGYTFNGWYTDITGGNKITATDIFKETADKTLYARWTSNKVGIKYRHNNNTATWGANDNSPFDMNSDGYVEYKSNSNTIIHTIPYGQYISITSGLNNWDNPDYIKFVRTGYTAVKGKEWIGVKGTNYTYFDHNDVKVTSIDVANSVGCNLASTASCNATMLVNWTAKTRTVTFKSNYSGGPADVTKTYTYDVADQAFTTNGLKTGNQIFTRSGYTLSGWATTSTGDVVYSAKNGVINSWINTATPVTLYAKWTTTPKAIITCANKTYNGSDQTIASCSNGNISGNVKKEAGNYTITCTGKSGYANADSKTCSINKKPAVVNCANKTYNGSDQTIASCTNGTPSNNVKKEAGNYTVTCTASNNNYSTATKTCSIAKSKLSITCANKTYNGSDQTIATCTNGNISNQLKKDAGNYTISCTAKNTNYANADNKTCSISKKKATITCTDKYYNGAVQTIATCDGGGIAGNTRTNIGAQNVTCSGDKNYSAADAKSCKIIAPAKCTISYKNGDSNLSGTTEIYYGAATTLLKSPSTTYNLTKNYYHFDAKKEWSCSNSTNCTTVGEYSAAKKYKGEEICKGLTQTGGNKTVTLSANWITNRIRIHYCWNKSVSAKHRVDGSYVSFKDGELVAAPRTNFVCDSSKKTITYQDTDCKIRDNACNKRGGTNQHYCLKNGSEYGDNYWRERVGETPKEKFDASGQKCSSSNKFNKDNSFFKNLSITDAKFKTTPVTEIYFYAHGYK